MSGICSIRYATIAALGMLAILWGQAGAAPPLVAAQVLEIRVLATQVQQGQGGRYEVLYSMEVLSVLKKTSRLEPGDIIRVRSYGQSNQVRERGWLGTAYLDPDPNAAGPDAGSQFVVAGQGEGLVDMPPAPPSLKFTIWPAKKGGQ